jgi:hypothetical protein
LRYPHAAAGLNHIATVLTDLGAKIDAAKLAVLSARFERAVVQRLGYLLCLTGHDGKVGGLHERLSRSRSLPWVELDPPLAADADFAPEPVARDERWRVIVRRVPEADE